MYHKVSYATLYDRCLASQQRAALIRISEKELSVKIGETVSGLGIYFTSLYCKDKGRLLGLLHLFYGFSSEGDPVINIAIAYDRRGELAKMASNI